MTEFFKENFKWLLVAGAFVFLYFNGCFTRIPVNPTVETKTVQVPQPVVIMPPYVPQQAGATVYPITIPQQYQPSTDLSKLTEQYNTLLKEFLAARTYKDSIQLKDTAGNRVGVVDLTQVVSENQLKSTQPTYQLNFPHTITTIREPYKPRNQVYLGVGIQAMPGIEHIQAGLMLKNKKDVALGVMGTYNFQTGKPGVNVSIFSKLSFKIWPR